MSNFSFLFSLFFSRDRIKGVLILGIIFTSIFKIEIGIIRL